MSETGRDLDRKAVLLEALARIEDLQAKLAAAERSKAGPIAVIGIGCRFPGGADGPDAYWRMLQNGVDAVREVPADRWEIARYFDPDPRAPGKTYTRWGGFLERVDTFDAEFFGIPPREALTLDPQHRLFLEVVWEALEHAGQAPSGLRGSQTGVFVGLTTTEYLQHLNKVVSIEEMDAYHASGNTPNAASGRVAFLLGLHGPSVSLDTACSSSLVATHLACQSLRNGDCDMAIAGGVNVILVPETYVCFSKWGMMSPVGRCKTFDASADGFVRAEGCGAVVLKRLSDAIENGDAILAVIRGSAVNQDGPSSGLSVPNGLAQQQVIRRALANAGVAPEQVGYVETHGTGTTLGDPIEVEALGEVFGPGRARANPLAIGSVKTNLGHMESAAGVAGLIKAVLTLSHGEIPPHIHLTKLTQRIPWDRLPFVVPTERTPWLSTGTPRFAGVSAFGFSGANAHIVLQEAPPSSIAAPRPDRTHHLLAFSAKHESALRDLAGRHAEHAETCGEPWADVCHTAAVGRSHFAHRAAVVASSAEEARKALRALAVGGAPAGKRPKVAFLFTGQGAQYAGMGRRLYETAPVFREALDRCDEILGPRLEQRLLSVLYPGNEAASHLDDTRYTQPALFALEYAVAALWRSWGILPSAVMGHSVGEYVAACVAGVFRLEDALELIAARGRLMSDLPRNGAMAAVLADEARVAKAIAGLEDRVSIAAINGPSSVVISGRDDAIAEVIERLGAEGLRTRRLNVSHAFHSPLMDPVLDPFEEVASRVAYEAPRIPLVSNVTGRISDAALIGHAGYWRQHVRRTVRFEASVRTLFDQGYRVFLEIGPGATLLGMGRQCIEDPDALWLHSLRETREDWGEMLASLGALYVRGADVNWEAFDRPYERRKVPAPTYPFQRRRFWVDGNAGGGRPVETATEQASSVVRLIQEGDAEALTRDLAKSGAVSTEDGPVVSRIVGALIRRHREELATEAARERMYEVGWREKPRPTSRTARDAGSPRTWLVLADEGGVGRALRARMEDRGERCVVVRPGAGPAVPAGGEWRIDPTRPEDYRALIEGAADRAGASLAGAVHLWSLDTVRSEPMTIESLDAAQRLGCQSLLFLAQAMMAAHLGGGSRLWAVTRGVVPADAVPGEASLVQAPVWGLGGVLALESPDIWGGMVDLCAEAQTDEVNRLFDELWEPDGEDQIAHRLAGRFVPRLRRVGSSAVPVPIVPNGAYLVTGGLGGLGLEVARWLARRGARHLLLLGRRGVASAEAKAVIEVLEREGVSVRVAAADVGDPEALNRVIAESTSSMPPLRGIVHAAGVAGYQPAEEIDASVLAAVLRPKLLGTWNLHRLTREMALDFFVGFSSIASVWGSKGQAHYAAANAFLDAFAHSMRGQGRPAVSVNWGPWTSGMSTPEFQSYMARLGVRALTAEEATGALGAAIDSGRSQVVVANVDWRAFKAVYEARGPRPLVDEIGPRGEEETPATSAEPPRLRREIEEAPPGRREKLLIARIQEEVAAVMGFEASELPDAQRGFFDAGMDSLMAVELRDRLQRALGVVLPATLAFDHPNIQVLARHLLGDVLALVPAGAVAEASPDTAAAERNELVERIKGLSDDSLEKLIGDELDALDGR